MRAELTARLAVLYAEQARVPRSAADWRQAIYEEFRRVGYRLDDSLLRKATHPRKADWEKGPRQKAAEVVGRVLGVGSRSLFNWEKLPRYPERLDENADAYRKLLAFLRALRSETRPQHQGDLRGIEAQVLARLRRKETGARRR